MPPSTPTSLDLSTPSPDYEHRSFSDDAWYTIRLLLQSELLIIKYPEFPDACDDDKYWAGYFDTAEKIREFGERFRVLSEQIQDRECGSVREGDRVCACGELRDGERRFYDAVVDAVRVFGGLGVLMMNWIVSVMGIPGLYSSLWHDIGNSLRECLNFVEFVEKEYFKGKSSTRQTD